MGWTSENVAEDFDITRDDMDELAALSFQRAEDAQKTGRFDAEIVPIHAFANDKATGKRTRVLVSRDDGIRPSTTKESLAKAEDILSQQQQTSGVLEPVAQGQVVIQTAAQIRAQIAAKEVALRGLETYATAENPAVQQTQQEIAGLNADFLKDNVGRIIIDGVVDSEDYYAGQSRTIYHSLVEL